MATRRRFLRGDRLVAVRHFNLDPGTRLAPGDEIPASTPLYRRRSLYRRRLVGVAGCPWAVSLIPARPAPPPEPEPLSDVEASEHET